MNKILASNVYIYKIYHGKLDSKLRFIVQENEENSVMLSIQFRFLALFLLNQTGPWKYKFLNQKRPSNLALKPIWSSASSTGFWCSAELQYYWPNWKGIPGPFQSKEAMFSCSKKYIKSPEHGLLLLSWPPYSSAVQAFSSVPWKRNIYWDVHIPPQTFLSETTMFFAFNRQNPGKNLPVQGNPDFTVQACTVMGHKTTLT